MRSEIFLRSNSRSEPKNHPFYRYARRGPHVVGSGILLIVLYCLDLIIRQNKQLLVFDALALKDSVVGFQSFPLYLSTSEIY